MIVKYSFIKYLEIEKKITHARAHTHTHTHTHTHRERECSV